MQQSEVRRAFVPFLRVRITVSVLVFSRSCRLGAYLPLANEIVSQCLHRFLCRTNINIRDFIWTNTLFDFSGPREELLRGQRVEESESQTGGPRHRSQQEDECLRAGSTSFCNQNREACQSSLVTGWRGCLKETNKMCWHSVKSMSAAVRVAWIYQMSEAFVMQQHQQQWSAWVWAQQSPVLNKDWNRIVWADSNHYERVRYRNNNVVCI